MGSSWTKLKRYFSLSTAIARGGAAGCGVADIKKIG